MTLEVSVDNGRHYMTPASSRCRPSTPPPSLSSSVTDTKRYTRNLLLSLATPESKAAPLQGLDAMQLLRKDSTSDWGIGEEHSDMLDGEPISKSMPIPRQAQLVGVEGNGHPADMLFDYQSTPGDAAVPILIDFARPNPFSADGVAGSAERIASSSVGDNSHTASWSGDTMRMIRLGARVPSISRSSSPSLSDTSTRKRSDSVASISSTGGLNPFAAPWPLPQTTPKVTIANTPPSRRPSACDMTSSSSMVDSSLPLPKPPSSLPQRPSCPLPPVFVKRESAALPQPMGLPDVAPMGQGWEGDKSLSGNERRRRASEAALVDSPLRVSTLRLGQSMDAVAQADERPEHLVRLGQRLRASVAAQGAAQ